MAVKMIEWIDKPDAKHPIPRWTVDGSVTQTICESCVMAGYVFEKVYGAIKGR